MQTSCEALVYAPALSTEQVDKLRVTVERVARPAGEEWTRGRLATLLSHYWIDKGPDELKEAVANDWVAIVMGEPCPPDWAINKACLAWLGGKDARKKPLPGEIRAMAIEQMSWVYLIQSRLYLEDHPEAAPWHPMQKYRAIENDELGGKAFSIPKLGAI